MTADALFNIINILIEFSHFSLSFQFELWSFSCVFVIVLVRLYLYLVFFNSFIFLFKCRLNSLPKKKILEMSKFFLYINICFI